MNPRETDRGTWWLVAQRDFWFRLRDKGFLISTGITLAIFTVFILIRAYGGGDTPTFDLGLLGDGSTHLGPLVVSSADAQNVKVRTSAVTDRNAAEAGLKDGSLDAVLVDGSRLLVQKDAPASLEAAIQAAVVADDPPEGPRRASGAARPDQQHPEANARIGDLDRAPGPEP